MRAMCVRCEKEYYCNKNNYDGKTRNCKDFEDKAERIMIGESCEEKVKT